MKPWLALLLLPPFSALLPAQTAAPPGNSQTPAVRGFPAQGEDVAVSRDWADAEWVIEPKPMRLRTSYEGTKVGTSEHLGLYGLHLDFLDVWDKIPGAYLGMGGYGAAGGRRGGLFTGGITLGWQHDLPRNYRIDAGAYFGAGGGGSAPQGSGEMLRQFLALEYAYGRLGIRVEASNIDFPSGDIGDTQVGLGLSWAMSPWVARTDHEPARDYSAAPTGSMQRLRVGLSTASHNPASDALQTNGSLLDSDIGMIGARLDAFFDDHWFLTFDAHGALNGQSDGYAELFGGLGYALRLMEGLDLETTLEVGSGGGGGVDTGGGFLVKPTVGLRAALNKTTSIGVGGGRIYSVNGDFNATTFQADLMFGAGLPDYVPAIADLKVPENTPLSVWYLEISDREYYADHKARLKSGAPMQDVSELGLTLAYPLNPHLDFTGSGFSAYNGGAGGYSEGWVGLRARYPVPTMPSLEGILSANIGAGGGGGIDVSNGFLWDVRAGISYALSPSTSLDLSYGRTEAGTGTFAANTLQFGLGWRFALPVAY